MQMEMSEPRGIREPRSFDIRATDARKKPTLDLNFIAPSSPSGSAIRPGVNPRGNLRSVLLLVLSLRSRLAVA